MTCRICAGPLTAVSDDSDLSHPSCAPADPRAFEATSGPRVYGHGTTLAWWSRCGCGARVDEGTFVRMLDTPAGRRWSCPECWARDGALSASAPSPGSLADSPTLPAPRAVSDAAGPSYGPVPAPRTTTDTTTTQRTAA